MITAIKGILSKLFRWGVNYKYLYGSSWDKTKSDYLWKKEKGRKSIQWFEKKGKGSYFDKNLRQFSRDHIQMSEVVSYDIPETDKQVPVIVSKEIVEPDPQFGTWIPVPDEIIRRINRCNIDSFTKEELDPLRKILWKRDAIKIWNEIIDKKIR